MFSASTLLIVADAPDFLVLGLWLATGLAGFAAGAGMVIRSVRRAQRHSNVRTTMTSVDRIVSADERLVAA